jgi:hypothetical protein
MVLPKLFVLAESRQYRWLCESRFPQITNQIDLVHPFNSDRCVATESGFVPDYIPKKGQRYMIEELVSRPSTTGTGDVT